jgi:serine/threonine protein kinase
LRAELAILKLVKHTNCVQMKNVFESTEDIHIVMDFIEGGDLFGLMEKGHIFSPSEIMDVSWDLFSALSYLHARGKF